MVWTRRPTNRAAHLRNSWVPATIVLRRRLARVNPAMINGNGMRSTSSQ
ncbi:MAG: hypothetical protein HC860_24105 [Alkalinema sp. RU_4_3]|nr:hypothetical protein [Alkalinema sp. RU_4_3]